MSVVGALSLFTIVPCAVPSPMVASTGFVSINDRVSLLSGVTSPFTTTSTLPFVMPAGIVSVPDVDTKSEPAVAVVATVA